SGRSEGRGGSQSAAPAPDRAWEHGARPHRPRPDSCPDHPGTAGIRVSGPDSSTMGAPIPRRRASAGMTTVEVATTPTEVAPPRAPSGAVLPRWLAVAAALGAGEALLVAFPTYGLWWCAPIGVALLALAVHRRGFWAGTGLGALTGLTWYVMLLSW